MKKKVIKCVKGFDKDLKCIGFQYEIGKEYETPYIEMCEHGFHAIDETESPLSVFQYYSPCDAHGNPNRFCLVELSGKTMKEGNKTVGSKIKILEEIGIEGVVGLQREWAKTHSANNDEDSFKHGAYSSASNTDAFSSAANTGDYSVSVNTGNCSSASNTGAFSSAANKGDYSSASNTGDYSSAVNTGYSSVAANTGNCSSASNTGNYSSVINNGHRSSAINKGNHSLAANIGNYASSAVYGKSSIAAVFGKDCKVKGALGCALVLTESGDWDNDIKGYSIKNIVAVMVDGVNVKADTWYMLVDGKLTEVY